VSRLAIQPTKSNLLKLQEELDFAKTGHQLLEEKREILLLRIRELIDELQDIQHRLFDDLKLCYRALCKAALSLGWGTLDSIHARPEGPASVRVTHRHYMGLDLPQLTLEAMSSRPHYSPSGSNAMLDEAQTKFVELLPRIIEYAEREAHLFAMSAALKKTMKRVNALENIFIPDYQDTVAYVNETLEELEREEMYIRKLVKESQQ